MAQASKAKKAERRARRRATLAERNTARVLRMSDAMMQAANAEIYQLKGILFALLAQNGGTLFVTRGTQQQVIETFPRLTVATGHPEGDDQTLVLTLVEAAVPEAEETTKEAPPALSIRRVEDNEDITDDAAATTNEGAN